MNKTFFSFSFPTFSRWYRAIRRGKAGEKTTAPVIPHPGEGPARVRVGAHKLPLFTRLTIKDQTLFAKRLSFLMHAGVPLLESIHIMHKQAQSRGLKVLFEHMLHDVREGQSLHVSLSRFPQIFDEFFINVVRVGEFGGTLSENLRYLADELQKKHTLRRKVLGALVYPAIITVVTLGVTSLLTVYIFPKILPIFRSLNVDLPLSTRMLIGVSDYLREYGIVTLVALIIIGVVLVILHRKAPGVRHFSDRALVHLPIVGPMVRSYNMANLCRTVGLLLKSGITVTNAISVTADTTINRAYRTHLTGLSACVLRGEALGPFLETCTPYFPSIVAHTVAVGERTGRLSETFIYLSELYEEELDDLLKHLSSSIEPVLMIFMGIIVGFVAVSVITPIYEITQTLSNSI